MACETISRGRKYTLRAFKAKGRNARGLTFYFYAPKGRRTKAPTALKCPLGYRTIKTRTGLPMMKKTSRR